MSKLIIIAGLPGTGKTTVSNELSKRLGFFCLHKDSVKESFYDSMKMSSLEESKRLGYPSVKMILDLAEENIARGVDIILESPFHMTDVGIVFAGWRERYKISILSAIMQLDEEERKKRFLARERHRSHYDQKRTGDYPLEDVSFSYLPEKRLFLTADRPTHELAEVLVREIDLL